MTVAGARIVEGPRGVRLPPSEKCRQARKSVTCLRSFGVLVESREEIRETVVTYMTKAAERLRRSRLAAGVVTVARMLAARDADNAHPLRTEEEGSEVFDYMRRLEQERPEVTRERLETLAALQHIAA